MLECAACTSWSFCKWLSVPLRLESIAWWYLERFSYGLKKMCKSRIFFLWEVKMLSIPKMCTYLFGGTFPWCLTCTLTLFQPEGPVRIHRRLKRQPTIKSWWGWWACQRSCVSFPWRSWRSEFPNRHRAQWVFCFFWALVSYPWPWNRKLRPKWHLANYNFSPLPPPEMTPILPLGYRYTCWNW
jgi:hypothetical protein